MTDSLLIKPQTRLINPIDRRKFLLSGTAAGTGLLMPRVSFAAVDPCSFLNDIFLQAQQQSLDPVPWVRRNGALAAEILQRQIAEAKKQLEDALKRERELDKALIVDVIALVGGAAFLATSVAASAGLITIGGTAATVLLGAGLVFNVGVFFAQYATNSTPPDDLTIWTGNGILGSAAEEFGDRLSQGASAVSRNIGKFAKLGGQLLSAVLLGFTAKETWDTYSEDEKVEEEIRQLREALAELEPELQELRDREAMEDLRRASARALVEDLEPYMNGVCAPEEDNNENDKASNSGSSNTTSDGNGANAQSDDNPSGTSQGGSGATGSTEGSEDGQNKKVKRRPKLIKK